MTNNRRDFLIAGMLAVAAPAFSAAQAPAESFARGRNEGRAKGQS